MLTLTHCGRALATAVLAAAIFTLAASIWPDLLDHLRRVGDDPQKCPVCAARHTARAGAPTTPVVPVFTLLVHGLPTPHHESSVPALAILTVGSRAPPTIG